MGEVFGKKRSGWRGVAEVIVMFRVWDGGGGGSAVECDAALPVIEAWGIQKTS